MEILKQRKLSPAELRTLYPEFTRGQLNTMILNTFHLQGKTLETLTFYRSVRITGREFDRQLHDGSLHNPSSPLDDTKFQVIYQNCNPFAAKRAKELKLSYRKVQSDWNIPATVIVRVAVDLDGVREEN